MTAIKRLPPVPYSPDVEVLQPDEDLVVQHLSETFSSIINKTHVDLGHASRSVHAKSHGLLQGELKVHGNLSSELSQGLFQKTKTYPVIIRLSSIPGDPLRDSVSVPRGIAIKVLEVLGKRLPGSENATTQDFLMANGPAFAAPTAEKFLGTLKILAKTTDRAEWAKAALSSVLRPVEKLVEALGSESGLIKTLGGYPKSHPLGERYFTQAALRFGDYMAKFDIVPPRKISKHWKKPRFTSKAAMMRCGKRFTIYCKKLAVLGRSGPSYAAT